jgi:hypothetical protein
MSDDVNGITQPRPDDARREREREHQRNYRKKKMKRCADCSAFCGRGAERCRKCSQKKNAKHASAQFNSKAATFTRHTGAAFCGLRGPGGEWENGPTSVQGWATLDGTRI